MKRLALLVVLVGGFARAGTPPEIAAKLNDEGVELMKAAKYADAAARFQQAVANVPEAKYFFNLCVALFQQGKFGEALTSCDAAATNKPAKDLAPKIDAMVKKIRDEAKAQGVTLAPSGAAAGGTPAEIAARLAEEGRKLVYASNFAGASAKFREAIARSPEAKYFFDLCVSLYQEGKFAEALTACDGATRNSPPKDLVPKIEAMVKKINDDAKAQGIKLQPPTASQVEIAKRLADEGRQALLANKYADASRKFREAIARVPEPMYFFDLCVSLYQEGKFSEALTACDGASRNQPPKELVPKIDAMVKKIRDEAKAQGLKL